VAQTIQDVVVTVTPHRLAVIAQHLVDMALTVVSSTLVELAAMGQVVT
jgi:hypothetical protein